MTNIEQKALEMISAARKENPTPDNYLIARTALCRAIEQHEATKQEFSDFRQEVSDAVEELRDTCYVVKPWRDRLAQFIIPKPKPDPLVEVIEAWFSDFRQEVSDAASFRTALETYGLEIREKAQ